MHGVADSIGFQMSLLLFTALGGYQIAARIAQPAVVGVILAGIVIGPSVLGWVTYTSFVKSIAHLGAIILLFVIGLEFKIRTISNWRYVIMGLGMVPRGEVAMIIALLALNEKIIEQPAYVALIMMSLLTTLIVPLVLKDWVYVNEQSK